MSFILTSLMMYITGIDNFMQIDELLNLLKKTHLLFLNNNRKGFAHFKS